MRELDIALAKRVGDTSRQVGFALVIEGDCSIPLGKLAGAREAGPVSLVYINGHSNFRHPGSFDSKQSLGAVAGMDLTLATLRGETRLTATLLEPRHQQNIIQDTAIRPAPISGQTCTARSANRLRRACICPMRSSNKAIFSANN